MPHRQRQWHLSCWTLCAGNSASVTLIIRWSKFTIAVRYPTLAAAHGLWLWRWLHWCGAWEIRMAGDAPAARWNSMLPWSCRLTPTSQCQTSSWRHGGLPAAVEYNSMKQRSSCHVLSIRPSKLWSRAQKTVVSVQNWLKTTVSVPNYGTFAPGSESTMVWNFRSLELLFLELSLPGAKVLGFQELSLQGTFAPGNESSKNFRSNPKWLSVATFVHGYVRIGLRSCGNLHPSFNVCFTKALYRRLNYFSITHTHTFHSFTCVLSSLFY